MNPFVNIHTHHHNNIDNKDFIEIQNIDFDNIVNLDVFHFYSLGIHPWECQYSTDNELQLLSIVQHLDNSNLLAIGECGLDRACCSDFERQKNIFIKQIELSECNSKPLIIHSVRSYPDIISIRKETKAIQSWIIHGFQGNEQSAEQLLKHDDIYLSLGDVLFKNETRAKHLLQIIPSNKLFFETDIAERNIVEVYEKASLLSGITIDAFRKEIFDNFVKIFGNI